MSLKPLLSSVMPLNISLSHSFTTLEKRQMEANLATCYQTMKNAKSFKHFKTVKIGFMTKGKIAMLRHIIKS